jgi:hypothetical protein
LAKGGALAACPTDCGLPASIIEVEEVCEVHSFVIFAYVVYNQHSFMTLQEEPTVPVYESTGSWFKPAAQEICVTQIR